jgi:drug/metabolite transporter superfamily protein YnfA
LIAKTLLLLIVAAALEVGGDALIRLGLDGAKYWIAVGGLTLFVYGVMVNLTGLDFNRLMGIYITIFFVISQVISWLVFKQVPDGRILLGGGFIVAGGAIMMVMA